MSDRRRIEEGTSDSAAEPTLDVAQSAGRIARELWSAASPSNAPGKARAEVPTLKSNEPVEARQLLIPHGLPADFYLEDIASAVMRFRAQFRLLGPRMEAFPCARMSEGEVVPVDIGGALSDLPASEQAQHSVLHDRYALVESLQSALCLWVTLRPLDETEQLFLDGLTSHVSARLAASDSRAIQEPLGDDVEPPIEETKPPKGHLPFRVSCNTTGRTVRWSMAAVINFSPVFGGPTSPVDSFLRPGNYYFALADKGAIVYTDRGKYELPPKSTAHLDDVD